jgi:multisubunit Na+/H+ antiporter MnhC subunit
LHKELGGNIVKSNKTVKIIIFMALFLSAVILISVMTGAVKETTVLCLWHFTPQHIL